MENGFTSLGKPLLNKKKYISFQTLFLTAFIAFLIWFYFALPDPLFKDPYSTVVYDREGKLIGAKLADDQQWRFPPSYQIPEKFRLCLLYWEDEYFYFHPGINPVSLFKALLTNLKYRKIKRGGSTITMQVIRLALKNQKRTLWNKFIEILLALRLELRYSKEEILALYASHAPYGGNVVGLEAAAWRYYGRNPGQLSWAECATLAVLPNTPALIHPGKNRRLLYQKRNRLLKKLFKKGVIDSTTYRMAVSEPIPEVTKPFPNTAPHLVETLHQLRKGERIVTTLHSKYQRKVSEIVNRHIQLLRNNHIYNAAVLVADIQTGEVLAYVGNVTDQNTGNGEQIDMILVPRSTGSILKPLLYACAYHEGLILPTTLLKDVPVFINGYAPLNFDKSFRGGVPAQDALSMSLNVPAVLLLQSYGLQKFMDVLKLLHIKSLRYPASYYGLSLILGGAEITLWEATNLYALMAAHLNLNFPKLFPEQKNYASLTYFLNQPSNLPKNKDTNPIRFLGVDAIWFVLHGLAQKNRPLEDENWVFFESSQPIAWKTGTSFGFRDAWCIGVTTKYVVGVWVGNASNLGRDGLTGIDIAAPILFDVFRTLPPAHPFPKPSNAIKRASICLKSGYLASEYCPNTKTVWVPEKAYRTKPCPYHIVVHLNQEETKRVHLDCYNPDKIVKKVWFVLPPSMAYYYRRNHPDYKSLPPWDVQCVSLDEEPPLRLVYPSTNVSVFLPIDLDGTKQKVVFRAAHVVQNSEIYWFLDEALVAKTRNSHEVALRISQGFHTLTLMDNFGNSIQQKIKVVSK